MDIRDKSYNLSQYADSRKLGKRIGLYRYNSNPVSWFEWMFAQLPLSSGDRIAEFGCGDGSLWSRNAARLPEEAEIVLTDLSENMLRDCEANLREALAPAGSEAAARFRFEVADLSSIPFAPGSFDLAIANHVLYHVPDLDAALGGLAAILAPGGRLVASTIGLGDNRELAELFAACSARIAYAPDMIASNFLSYVRDRMARSGGRLHVTKRTGAFIATR